MAKCLCSLKTKITRYTAKSYILSNHKNKFTPTNQSLIINCQVALSFKLYTEGDNNSEFTKKVFPDFHLVVCFYCSSFESIYDCSIPKSNIKYSYYIILPKTIIIRKWASRQISTLLSPSLPSKSAPSANKVSSNSGCTSIISTTMYNYL